MAQLAVLSRSDVEYLGTASVERAPTPVAEVGVRLPAHLDGDGPGDAVGRVGRPGAGESVPAPGGPHRPARTRVATLAELDAILREVRERGWAGEDGEITDGYASVAATALDRNRYPAAAIGVTYRSATATDADVDAMAGLVVEAAGALTATRLSGG